MPKNKARRRSIDTWNQLPIEKGASRDVKLAISESYSGMTVQVPIRITRAMKDGPVVFVTAARCTVTKSMVLVQ